MRDQEILLKEEILLEEQPPHLKEELLSLEISL